MSKRPARHPQCSAGVVLLLAWCVVRREAAGTLARVSAARPRWGSVAPALHVNNTNVLVFVFCRKDCTMLKLSSVQVLFWMVGVAPTGETVGVAPSLAKRNYRLLRCSGSSFLSLVCLQIPRLQCSMCLILSFDFGFHFVVPL